MRETFAQRRTAHPSCTKDLDFSETLALITRSTVLPDERKWYRNELPAISESRR